MLGAISLNAALDPAKRLSKSDAALMLACAAGVILLTILVGSWVHHRIEGRKLSEQDAQEVLRRRRNH